ncbi:MAG: Fic family protein [Patescibacteria group bacterium]
MVVVSRYNVGVDESDILKNKLGITDQNELVDAETILLRDTYDHFLKLLYDGELNVDLDLLFEIHKYFLGTLYSWAGKIRNVDMSKNFALFAPAKYIKNSLKEFKADFEKNKPSSLDTVGEVAKKLAFIHCELNIIHPFRDGNGRTNRLFLDLLVVEAGYQLVDFTKISKSRYINACRFGMVKDYSKMEKIILKLLKKEE